MNTTPTPRPLPNSYWATPLLLASEYPGAKLKAEAAHRLDLLLAAGIRDFYDLTEATEGLALRRPATRPCHPSWAGC